MRAKKQFDTELRLLITKAQKAWLVKTADKKKASEAEVIRDLMSNAMMHAKYFNSKK